MTEIEKARKLLEQLVDDRDDSRLTFSERVALRVLLSEIATPPRITEEAVEAAARVFFGLQSQGTPLIVEKDRARAALTAALPLMGGDRGVEIGFPEGSENHKLAMEHNRDR